MDQLEDFVNALKPNYLCLLKKSLYGLKLFPMQWNRRFDKFMLQNGHFKCVHDPRVYFGELPSKSIVYFLVYVGGMLIVVKSTIDLHQLW